jgi:hypothetical protein
VPIIDDKTEEGDETFTLEISNVVNATPVPTSVHATIVANDAPPLKRFAIADIRVVEGGFAQFMIRAIDPITERVEVQYRIELNGTATGFDVFSSTGSSWFEPDSTVAFVTFRTAHDMEIEEDETFTLHVTATKGTQRESVDATCTIIDNDRPIISIADTSARETAGMLHFVLHTSMVFGVDVTVDARTVAGTATSGKDYQPVTTTVTIPAGATEAFVDVPIIDDKEDENSDSVNLVLSNPTQAGLESSSARGRILDDDSPIVLPEISIEDVRVNEGASSATFVLRLSSTAPGPVEVFYETQPGTAAAPEDYTSQSGKAFIATGQTSTSVVVPVVNDSVLEPDETFVLALSNESGAYLQRASATCTILNDDKSGCRARVPSGTERGVRDGAFA